ncbi:hypothetical protein L7F22_047942 [Adiantum nelumboides]|nr:hypothetical protein [Adiantum nelumboides]
MTVVTDEIMLMEESENNFENVNESVELLVRMDCHGCEQKVRKQLAKLKGVDSVEIELSLNKVTVYGYVNRIKVLKAVRKTGKRAEFWQEAFNGVHNFSHHDNYEASRSMTNFTSSRYSHSYTYNKPSKLSSTSQIPQIQPFKHTYNYKKHGYNNYDHAPDESLSNYHEYGYASHATPSLFSDDHPNGCIVM